MAYFAYILECSDLSFYVGKTTNLERRLYEHNSGFTPYTKNRKPVKLVYSERFDNLNDAIKREKEIKGWSRIKKINLINKSLRRGA
jgi:putative endonuclease